MEAETVRIAFDLADVNCVREHHADAGRCRIWTRDDKDGATINTPYDDFMAAWRAYRAYADAPRSLYSNS